MNKLDKHISIAKDVASCKGHWLVPFKKTSKTIATSTCKNCGAKAIINIDPPSFPVTMIREGDAFYGASCEHRLRNRKGY